MNKWIGIGRLTKDPEIKLTSNQTQFCQFTVAVERKFKDQNGQRQADFINCIAWKNTAVFIQKYFRKGNRIGLTGSIQIRSYEDQNGQKHFITEVIIDEAEFVESQNTNQAQSAAPVDSVPSQTPIQVTPDNSQNVAPQNTKTAVNEPEISTELPFEI